MKLFEILNTVIAPQLTDDQATEYKAIVYKNLDVRRCQQPATLNIHLLNPRNDELGGFHARNEPLTGDEEVQGDFLTLHHSSHDDDVLLLAHDSLAELESEILSPSGLLNPFTLWIDAIIDASCRSYELTFSLDGQRTSFNKDAQFACEYGNDGAADLTPYVSCRIEWV